MFAHVMQHMYLFLKLILVHALIHNHILIKLPILALHAQILETQRILLISLIGSAFVILIMFGIQLKTKLHAFAQITHLLLLIVIHASCAQPSREKILLDLLTRLTAKLVNALKTLSLILALLCANALKKNPILTRQLDNVWLVL